MTELSFNEIDTVNGGDMNEVYVTAAAVTIGFCLGGPPLAASVLLHAVVISALN